MLDVRSFVVALLIVLSSACCVVAPAYGQQVGAVLVENQLEPGQERVASTAPELEQVAIMPTFDAAEFAAKANFMVLLSAITAGLMVFTLALLVAIGWKTGLNAEFTRTLILVVIVFAALYLISAGYSNEQAAPVYGLLGTIAGYLFGRASEPKAAASTDGAVSPGKTGTGGGSAQPTRENAITPGPVQER